MSTSYEILPLFEGSEDGLSIDEHSNLFDISMSGRPMMLNDGVVAVRVRDLSPDQLVKLAARILNVASYWMSDEDYEVSATKHLGLDVCKLAPWESGGESHSGGVL